MASNAMRQTPARLVTPSREVKGRLRSPGLSRACDPEKNSRSAGPPSATRLKPGGGRHSVGREPSAPCFQRVRACKLIHLDSIRMPSHGKEARLKKPLHNVIASPHLPKIFFSPNRGDSTTNYYCMVRSNAPLNADWHVRLPITLASRRFEARPCATASRLPLYGAAQARTCTICMQERDTPGAPLDWNLGSGPQVLQYISQIVQDTAILVSSSNIKDLQVLHGHTPTATRKDQAPIRYKDEHGREKATV
ncbi:hypothetical protein M441DRAFT_50232 [Trichoderma asperellum CBS 433.97]|uniref:Uncharacterized protein n=1 Tax=Trichoderma asperellum (strain ATCC 204424 / CBS 433.97 / NBRC 101777) TaxID=1042311 RepID=A0A2T3YZ40_TRIA4|nr:hypothetical protein M441DRAFT_50232 [Trichoderma asperellum CBS 433.97]PTB37815.1 hypothetical protein M441DRAFT_50232 [Trichoderma asperellum CBS 433.97]